MQHCISKLAARKCFHRCGWVLRCTHSYITEDLIRNHILEDENKLKIIRRIGNLEKKILTPKNKGKTAAVLMPLCIVNGQLSFLYTLRSSTLSSHSGQVSFPGGISDESDPSLVATALRETKEEIGVCPTEVEVWTTMTSFPDRRNIYQVTPVIGYLRRINLEELTPNPKEVADIFTVPITKLLSEDFQGYTLFRNGWKMPVFLAKYTIWGLTAIATDVFLANAFPDIYKLKIHKFHGDVSKLFLKEH